MSPEVDPGFLLGGTNNIKFVNFTLGALYSCVRVCVRQQAIFDDKLACELIHSTPQNKELEVASTKHGTGNNSLVA